MNVFREVVLDGIRKEKYTMSRRNQEQAGASRQYCRAVGCAIFLVGLIVRLGAQAGPAMSSGDVPSHFGSTPPLTGTPSECNAAVRAWLLTGASNIVADMQDMIDDVNLSNQSVLSFQQRIRSDFSIEIAQAGTVTNTEKIIKEFEAEVRTASTAEELRLSQDNLKHAKAQLEMLSFNKERIATLRTKLTELDQACTRWADRWERALRGASVQEARRQLQLVIKEKRANFLQWLGTEQRLGK